MDSLKEVFSFSRAETIALCLLLAICLIGGGALIYEHSRQSLPPQLIFESISAEPNSPQKDVDVAKVTSSSAQAANLHSRPTAFTDSRNLRLNLNTAPGDSLAMLPFVGETLSARIIDYREKNGGYDSVGQLVEIYGIGPKSLEKLRPYLFCE